MDFSQLVITSHQVFFSIVLMAYSYFCLADIEEIKSNLSREDRVFMCSFLALIGLGAFAVLYNAWGNDGIFFAFEFAVFTVLGIIRPKFAVGFIVYLLLARPWETYDNQMMSSMPRDMSYLAILSIAAHKFINKEFYFKFNKGTFLLICFAVWMFLSAFLGPMGDEALFQYFEVFIKGIILFILIQNGIRKGADLLPIKVALVFAILEKCFISYYKTMTVDESAIIGPVQRLVSVGILSNSNDIAAIFILALPFTLMAIMKLKILRPFNWALAIFAVIGFTYLVWQAQSRGAVLGLMSVFAAWAYVSLRSKKMMIIATAAGLVLAIGSFGLMSRAASDTGDSTSNRIVFWKAGINMGLRKPLFGVGFWGFNSNVNSYIVAGDSATEKNMTAHSSWILPLAEGGVPALVFFASLWLYGMWSAWQIRLREPEYFMAMVGYGVVMSFLSHTYLLYPYVLLAIVISHRNIHESESAEASLNNSMQTSELGDVQC